MTRFTIEVYDHEIGLVAAALGRTLQVTRIAREKRTESPENGPPRRKAKPEPILHLLTNEGPTTRLLAFAAAQQAPFVASQARDYLGDAINKDSFYSTLDRLSKQGVLAVAQAPGHRKSYTLTDTGRKMMERTK